MPVSNAKSNQICILETSRQSNFEVIQQKMGSVRNSTNLKKKICFHVRVIKKILVNHVADLIGQICIMNFLQSTKTVVTMTNI